MVGSAARITTVVGLVLGALSPNLVWIRGIDDRWTLFEGYPVWLADRFGWTAKVDGWVVLLLPLIGMGLIALTHGSRRVAVATAVVGIASFALAVLEAYQILKVQHNDLGIGVWIALVGSSLVVLGSLLSSFSDQLEQHLLRRGLWRGLGA